MLRSHYKATIAVQAASLHSVSLLTSSVKTSPQWKSCFGIPTHRRCAARDHIRGAASKSDKQPTPVKKAMAIGGIKGGEISGDNSAIGEGSELDERSKIFGGTGSLPLAAVRFRTSV